MQIWCMAWCQESQWVPSSTYTTRLLSIFTPRNKEPSRLPPMGQSTSQDEPQRSKSWTTGSHFDTSGYLWSTHLFGDNKSVVDSSMKIASKIHKRHVLLSYHQVREAIAAGVLYFIHIPGAEPSTLPIFWVNTGVILNTQVKKMLAALFFWEGDTGRTDKSRDIEEERL